MPIYELKTLGRQLDETLLTERLIALLSAGFGLLATLLAAIGLYGVMAFVVARRTKELGVRMALGAQPASVIWLVMQGSPAAAGVSGWRSAFRRPSGWAVLSRRSFMESRRTIRGLPAPASPVLIVVACLAGLIPARRASRIDPILALRYE